VSDADLDLIAAYAVGALEGHERDDVERLLEQDPAMRAALARHLDTLAALADEAEPPPGLLDRILADLPDQQPPVTRDALSLTRRPAEHPAPAMTPARHVASVAALDEARRARAGRIVRTVLAAAAVVALLLVGIGLVARDDEPDGIQDLAAAALEDPDARLVELAVPDTTASVARAAVFDDGAGYLVVDDLPALPAGETYQLWMLPGEGTDPISLGLVDPTVDGGAASFRVAPDAAGVALSREPAGGSVVPTEVVAAGTFT
jgi:anti-sigma-K factor RskA